MRIDTRGALMKLLIICLLSLNIAFANSISGVIEVKGKVPSGVLYIFAKKYDGKMPMPLAVKKIEKPTFPLKFSLSAADKMMPNMPFNGPFKVVARLSPSGDASDKSGVEAVTTAPVKMGDKAIKLVLTGK